MRKNLIISDPIGKLLTDTAEKQNTTQSKLVEQALVTYFLLNTGAELFANSIKATKAELQGQKTIYDYLNKDDYDHKPSKSKASTKKR